MPTISTLSIDLQRLASLDRLQVYNGLDAAVTMEVWEALDEQFARPAIYDFECALQAPYLEIMNRGFAVDQQIRASEAGKLRARIVTLTTTLNALATAVWDHGVNPRSPVQLRQLFYETMKFPEVWLSQKGERKLSTNREALEKLEIYLHARPFVNCILAIRDLSKQLEVLETEIDQDGRFRASYNIAGTETGRPSSSTNAFGTGGNAQNIAPGLRHVFVSDPGWKLVVIDLEQVEARDVGFFCGSLLGDWSYLDACESGDLHTNNAKLVWRELPWTGDPSQDRQIADQKFYRDFSYRDMSKRGGHASNYMGTAWTIARVLKVPISLLEDFQARYILGDTRRGIIPAFPAIPLWWRWVAERLQLTQSLTTPFGRERHFFNRPGDDATLREAIAFLPQSTTADRMNLGLWRIWRKMPQVRLLAQTYDSVTFQARDDETFDANVAEALAHTRVDLVCGDRVYWVPGEAKVGWNWGSADAGNPSGLVKWKPGRDERARPEHWMRRIVG